MTHPELIAEITAAFQAEPYPGDAHIVDDNSGLRPEGGDIRNVFRGHPWQAVPDEVLATQRASLSGMSKAGFKYYLPAFMCSLLRNSRVVDDSAGTILSLLKLPTEVDTTAVTEKIQRYEVAGKLPDAELEEFLQSQLAHTNKAINAFIARAAQFTQAQGRAICHFLSYVRDEANGKPSSREADLAIQRYWFQFAQEAVSYS